MAGFVASFTAKNKEKYIIKGGVGGIDSSFAMLLVGILLQGTPMGFSSWNTLGILSLGLSMGGARFVLGIVGVYGGNWLQK